MKVIFSCKNDKIDILNVKTAVFVFPFKYKLRLNLKFN